MIGYRNNSSNVIINTQVTTQPPPDSASLPVNKSGQSFYEILTQQPYKFSKDTISANNISITLRWNYDLILAMQENNNIAKLSNFADYTQSLPFIKKIYIDIAGRVDLYHPMYNNMWISVDELTISGDYNVYDYKHYNFQRENYTSNSAFPNSVIHNIISKGLPFSIRIYGENYSNNYPSIESRALIFDNLTFAYINPPSKPLFIGATNSSTSQINYTTLTYYNTNSIMLDTQANINTNAKICNYNIDYGLITSLASTAINRSLLNNNNQNINSDFLSNIYSDMSFNIILTNLMSGSNYYHKIQVKNIYTNIYSSYSDISSTNYTLIPNNNAIGSSLDMSIKSVCYKYISNNNLNNANVLYININNSAHNLLFNNSSNQYFQITHPYFDNQHLEPYYYGYGKFIDNCFNLVTINLSINHVIKQTINYGGFDVSNSNNNETRYNYSMNNFTNNRILISCNHNNIEDIYDNNSSYVNKGFRLKGSFSLIDEIPNNNIVNFFGDPSSNPYILNINYIRHPSVDILLGSNVIHNIYIDNLIGSPSVSIISNNVSIHEVVYTMGVASVKYFTLDLIRRYSNINSINKYIVGNRIIANFSTSENIGITNQNIILPQSDICANGIYIYDDISFTHCAYFQNTHHDYSFNLTEKIYNLNNINGHIVINNINNNHYCDYNSFNKLYNVIFTSKLDLSVLHIYEISNILLLGSNLANIQLAHYINHNNEIKNCTLLYLNSYFSNSFSLYPNSNDYNYYTGINYNTHGTISYNLDGTNNTLNQGYKWIVFKIYKSLDISNAYTFNNINYTIITTNDGENVKYLPLKIMLKNNNLFTHTIVDAIFDNANEEAVMFGHATTLSNSYKRFFNVKVDYSALGGIWTEHSISSAISYNSTINNNNSIMYGSNVNNDGIYLPIIELMDDLTIYIGLKNSI